MHTSCTGAWRYECPNGTYVLCCAGEYVSTRDVTSTAASAYVIMLAAQQRILPTQSVNLQVHLFSIGQAGCHMKLKRFALMGCC